MSAIVRWEAPPPRTQGTNHKPARVHDWPTVGKTLARRPGRWAIIAACDNAALAGTMAYYIRKGAYVALAEHGVFEAVARTIDGQSRVYARWVGEPS